MSDNETIKPAPIAIPAEALEDLRRRIATARWPEREATRDHSQGVPLDRLRALVDYWGREYDWRRWAFANLIHWNEVERGGHFAAWEQPEIFVEELRTCFRAFRGASRGGSL